MDNLLQVLNECSDEPIKTPNSIQPFGFSIIVDTNGVILYISNNISLIVKELSEKIIGNSITTYFNINLSDLINCTNVTFHNFELKDCHTQNYYGYIVKIGDLYSLEIYNDNSKLEHNYEESFQNIIFSKSKLNDFCSEIASYIFHISNYDRVLIYKFDENYNGSVISEMKQPYMETYLGHHFPADDIPSQARALYVQNLIRIIPNASYTPIRFFPEPQTLLDMTHSTLRSVSPIHCQYLSNMNVKSSMSLSLIVNNSLWGLIACHSRNEHNIHPLLQKNLKENISTINHILENKVNEQEDDEINPNFAIETCRYKEI